MTELAVTARCVNDLEALDGAIADHILTIFEERRSANPDSGEPMARVGGPIRKLHADMSGHRSLRAVTWYDKRRDVCWLLAAGVHQDFYEGVEELNKKGLLFPTAEDVANFESEAHVRLLQRVVRNARRSLEMALGSPGQEVPVTDNPPPKASFRVEADKLWVRVVIVEAGKRQVFDKDLAAIWVGVFGQREMTLDFPPGGSWDSLYLVGPVPDLNEWPPRAVGLSSEGTS